MTLDTMFTQLNPTLTTQVALYSYVDYSESYVAVVQDAIPPRIG